MPHHEPHQRIFVSISTIFMVAVLSTMPSTAARVKDALSRPPDRVIETTESAQDVRDCFVEQRVGDGITVEYKNGWLANENELFYVVILPAGSGAHIEVHLGPNLMHVAYDNIANVCLNNLPQTKQ